LGLKSEFWERKKQRREGKMIRKEQRKSSFWGRGDTSMAGEMRECGQRGRSQPRGPDTGN